jgi:hypothetical protein
MSLKNSTDKEVHKSDFKTEKLNKSAGQVKKGRAILLLTFSFFSEW